MMGKTYKGQDKVEKNWLKKKAKREREDRSKRQGNNSYQDNRKFKSSNEEED